MESDIRIVILQRGWVMVGEFHAEADGQCKLTDAKVIRRWGTTKGLGELVDGPLKNTVLDPAGEVQFHEMTVIATIRVKADKWQ